jgi:hypothetical protein
VLIKCQSLACGSRPLNAGVRAHVSVMPRHKSAARLLVGTWRSDRKRTTEQWVYPKRLADARRKAFEAIFGKMKVRYTRTRHFSEFEGRKWTAPYWSSQDLVDTTPA